MGEKVTENDKTNSGFQIREKLVYMQYNWKVLHVPNTSPKIVQSFSPSLTPVLHQIQAIFRFITKTLT